jgi:hypothetical protein
MRHAVLISVTLLASPAVAAGPIIGTVAGSYVDSDDTGPGAAADIVLFATDNSVAAVTASQGPGATISAKAQSGAWLNRLAVTSDITKGWGAGGAVTQFAINQSVTGAPGSMAHISYAFSMDGSFVLGPDEHYIPPAFFPKQYVQFYTGAYAGTAYSVTEQTDFYGNHLLFDASNGMHTISRSEGYPGYLNTLTNLIAIDVACDETASYSRCADGGLFADTLTFSFDVQVGESFYIFGYFFSRTNGEADFFSTTKLLSIDLAPEFGLVSEDGGVLVRNPNGTYHLPVPEPGTWALLVAGFGLTGVAVRRRGWLARA